MTRLQSERAPNLYAKIETVKIECRCRNCLYQDGYRDPAYPRDIICRADGQHTRRDLDDFCSRGEWNGEEE